MTILKLYYIYNTIENKLIFNSNSEQEYIDRVRLIAKENEQEYISINSYKDCDKYILEHCTQNLDLEPNNI